MAKVNLFPADTYVVVNKTILNDLDRRILTMLYQPIIGGEAINLYFTLWSYLDKGEITSREWTHHHLMASIHMNIEDIIEAREKLEAIGLICTFIKKEEVNNYIYELYSPISSYEFFNNPILSSALFNNIGQAEYENVTAYFSLPKIKKDGYEDITCLFTDIFEISINSQIENVISDIKKRNKRSLQINSELDLNHIFGMIPEEILNLQSITKETKDLIYKLGFIYNLDNETTVELIKNSIDDRKTIDKELLKKNSRNLFKFENYGKLPSIAYKCQPEYLRKKITDISKKSKMIYAFEITSPSDFLRSKTRNGIITQSEKDVLAYLLLELNLNPGVVNVLIDYVLKINNNKLTKGFVEAIASQWSRSNIETVEDAMNMAEEEYKKRNNIKSKTKQYNKKIIDEKPEWFDKDIESKNPTDSRKKEIEAILNEYR